MTRIPSLRHHFNGGNLLLFCAAILVALLYLAGLGGGFILDDKPNITENVALYTKGLDHVSLWRAASSFHGGAGLRAIPMLTFGLDYFRADSFDPATFKATNIAIHVITFLVLAGFLRTLLTLAGQQRSQAWYMALFIAMLWALHPLQVSSVLYVVQRMQTLATLFMLLALWSYLTLRQAQIAGSVTWRGWHKVLLWGLLALASKEDAVLLPAYGLILEWTVLRFRGANAKMERIWFWGYTLAAGAAMLVFLFIVLPHYWSMYAFPGRDFSSPERLLTQGRVLLMHLGQILWPLPDNMPFYYDDFPVSRSWHEPSGTAPAWLAIVVLLALAWVLRQRRPLVSLGILWFFAGHFITSNVFGLEMVFEHRNHLPLVGIALAFADAAQGAAHASIRICLRSKYHTSAGVLFAVLLLALLGWCTWQRVATWGNDLAFAEKSVEIAPSSPRAWVALCFVHYEAGKNDYHSVQFSRAISTCERGGALTGSVMALANVVIFKTLRGDITQQDWGRLLERFHKVPMSPENVGIAMNMVGNANHGIALDPQAVLAIVEIVRERGDFSPYGYVSIARFVLDRTSAPENAYFYLKEAVSKAAKNKQFIAFLLEGLRQEGREDWAKELENYVASHLEDRQP